MTLEDAFRINSECLVYCTAYLIGSPPENAPPAYTLRELIDARDMVRQQNDLPPDENGIRAIHMFCDDRILAAMYSLANYPAEALGQAQPILLGGGKALYCLNLNQLVREENYQ